jgi:hypothetical protein
MPSSAAQVDAPTCDFIQFVALRRQLSEEAASWLIGDGLMSYEPGPMAQRHREERRATAKRPVCAARAPRARRPGKAA